MRDFQYVVPSLRLFAGERSLEALGRELKRIGVSRPMVICGRTMSAAPELDLLLAALGDRLAGVYAGVRAHSPVPDVLAAARALQEARADGVIALGGGSAIVTARAASILLAEGEDVGALATRRGEDGRLVSPRLDAPKLPQLVIPTTPTTAIVKAGSALFEPLSGGRLALFDPKTRAQSVFLHPALLATAPVSLYKTAGMNGLGMAIEGLVSRSGNPLADGLLMHALRLSWQGLRALNGGDPDTARGDLTLAAILCGQGTDHTGAGITTVLGHAIGATHDLENGTVNGVVLPHVLNFNAEAAPVGYAKVAAALELQHCGGSDAALVVGDAIGGLLDELGMPRRLGEIGVSREALSGIADAAMGDWFLTGNPRKVESAGQILSLLEAAW